MSKETSTVLLPTLNELIIDIRCQLQERALKKSGKNKFAGFEYYELKDFLPTLNKLMSERQVNDIVTFNDNEVTLTLVYKDEKQPYSIPFINYDTPLNNKGVKSMQDIQYLGALITYYKRYLYMNAFGITDGEVIDALNNEQQEPNKQPEMTREEIAAKADADQKDTANMHAKRILVKYCNENDIDMQKVADDFKLNKESVADDFNLVLAKLKNVNTSDIDINNI